MKELNDKIGKNVETLRKVRALRYYMDPSSTMFYNAYRSLIRAGYSPSYAGSYCSKVFDMPGFIEILAKAFVERKNEGE